MDFGNNSTPSKQIEVKAKAVVLTEPFESIPET